jgi:hypothetical protein
METSKKQILIRSKKIIQMMTGLVETGEKDDQIQLAVLCDKEYGNFDYNFIIELWKSNYRLRKIDLIKNLKYYLSDEDINFYAGVIYLEFIKKFQINRRNSKWVKCLVSIWEQHIHVLHMLMSTERP